MKFSISTIVVLGMLGAFLGVRVAAATPAVDRPELVQRRVQVEATPTLEQIPLASPTPTSTSLPATMSSTTISGTAAASLTSTSTVTSTLQAEVLAAALNIRQGPGLSYPVQGVALVGDKLEVVGRDNAGIWLQVKTPAGGLGWISGVAPYARLLNGSPGELPVAQVSAPAAISSSSSNVGQTGSVVNEAQSSSVAGGERLIFASRSGGDLYSINIDGSDLRYLASGVIDPVVSPDGQQVAFTRWDGDEFGAVHILNLVDGTERIVAGDIRQPKSPTWSPDGQKLVVSFQHGGLRDPQEECREYDAGERVRIPENAVVTRYSSSDDGVSLCFIRNEDLQWMLREVDLASGVFEDLPSDEYAYNPAWDPQAPWRVIYDGKNGLMQMDVTNGNQWPMTEDLRDTGPVFSPDGQRLALTYEQHDHWEVYTFDPVTHARQRLTKPPILANPQYNSAAPAWSPDGSQLAFMTDRTGRWEIWVMNADGSQQRPLFSPELQAQLGLEYHGVNERLLNWIE